MAERGEEGGEIPLEPCDERLGLCTQYGVEFIGRPLSNCDHGGGWDGT